MVWQCNVGPLVKIEGIMKKEDCLNILQTNLPEYVGKSAYTEKEIHFQQDGDHKHSCKIIGNWLSDQKF